MPERDLLVFLLNKETFNNYYEYLDRNYLKDNYRELFYLYSTLSEAHKTTEHSLTLADLQAFFFFKYPDLDKELYLELFKTLSETKIEPSMGGTLLKQIKARKQALALSEAAFKFSNGNGSYDDVEKATQNFVSEEETKEEFEFVTTSLSTIISDIFQKPGLRWRLDALNKSLGSLRKGNFGFLFARPEVGKTTFLASEISYMLTQLGSRDDHSGPIIWFNNEQVGAEVMLRVYQAYFGLKLEQIKSDPKRFEKQFQEETKGKFRLVDNALVDKQLVERILKQFNPSLVVFDQIDKIKGFAADREDLRLGAIYIWARELAKQYCPIIGICQAGGTAENVKWLTMDHVANASTSKQAEADWILGMGHIHDTGMQFIRYLNISKNKMLGDQDTLPRLRHAKLEVLIDPECARFKDIINYGD